ncbi:type II toxin-antitoxin system RelE/ParE family toxin [Candidatus Babeliales bacterium]|nr:type II toxin-antitoxin system RelE/ParE family toxin [Candidatus Babeliales bacterium]
MSSSISFKNYHVQWLKVALKAIESIPNQERAKILEKTKFLAINQDQLDIKKLKGYKSVYRIRSGDYRIVIEVSKEEKTIYVTAIGHRKHVYDLVKKLFLIFGISSMFGLHS